MLRFLPVLAATLFAATCAAQFSVTIPNGTANAPGNTSNAFPWGNTASGWGGLRLMAVYGAVNFTNQNVNSPILINRLKWRPNDTTGAVTGGTYSAVKIELSTSPTGFGGVTTNYNTNHGADRTLVYDAAVNGPVTHIATPGAGGWTPQSWCVDITLATPFTYDPSQGDLVIDVDYPTGSFSGGNVGQMDVHGSGSNAARIYASSMYPLANGTSQSHGPVVEVGYLPPTGYGFYQHYGTGCYDVEDESFYESFGNGANDLSGTSMSLFYTPDGYVAIGGVAAYVPPTGATSLAMSDDSEVTRPITSGSIPYGHTGLATSLTVCSNGFVSVGSNGVSANPTTAGLLGAANTAWWNWHNYNPAAAGSGAVKWEETASHVYVTWDGVFSDNTAGPGSTFQYQFEKGTGHVHVVWVSMSATGAGHIVGFSEGGASNDPGGIDLTAVLPSSFNINFEINPIAITASARPVLGTTFNLETSLIPAGSPIAGTILGLAEYNPGISLTSVGMPGCEQYCSADAVVLYIAPGTTATLAYPLPNNPSLAGVEVKAQSAALVSGLNPLGAVSSNGLRLTLDLL